MWVHATSIQAGERDIGTSRADIGENDDDDDVSLFIHSFIRVINTNIEVCRVESYNLRTISECYVVKIPQVTGSSTYVGPLD